MKTRAIALIAGEFHRERVALMVEEARREAERCNLTVVRELWVPGSFEMPLVLDRVLDRTDIDGAALLGIIERGETKHGLVMGQAVLPKVLELQLKHQKPVGIGIIGPEVLDEQIEPRLKPHASAAVRAVHRVSETLDQLQSTSKRRPGF